MDIMNLGYLLAGAAIMFVMNKWSVKKEDKVEAKFEALVPHRLIQGEQLQTHSQIDVDALVHRLLDVLENKHK